MPRPPSTFHGFIGQRQIVDRLRQQLAGARAHGEPCPPTLLIGPSGVGKTELARAIAAELTTQAHLANGQDRPVDLAAVLLGAKAGDVVFVDEVHGAKPKTQELLYEVIDRSRIPNWALAASPGSPVPVPATGATVAQPVTSPTSPVGPGEWLPLPSLTLILATDQPGRLRNALYKRMELVLSLQPYPAREMRAIVDRVATDLRLLLSGQARNRIAEVAAGLPRLAKHSLRNLRRHVRPDGHVVGLSEVRDFLRTFAIDRRGLNNEHRKLLNHLSAVGKASIDSLAAVLGTDPDYVLRQVEPRLMQLGLIRIGPGGRTLTDAGREWRAAHDKTQRQPVGERSPNRGTEE